MENDKPKPIDAEVSKTKAFGGGFGDYTKEKQETQDAVRAAENIIKGKSGKNFFKAFIQRLRGKQSA